MSFADQIPSRSTTPIEAGDQQLIAFRFDDEEAASAFAGDVMAMHRSGDAEIHDAVFVTKNAIGDTTVIDRVAQTPAKHGALRGGFWGALLGIMAGGPVAGLAIGAGIGALHARLPDRGIDRSFIRDIGDNVRSDSVVLILLVSHIDRHAALTTLHRHAGIALAGSRLPPETEQFLRSQLSPPEHPGDAMSRLPNAVSGSSIRSSSQTDLEGR